MTDQNESGISLKNDIASIRTDPTFHDVVLVCADGVEIGACRAILASRSAVFKAMFYGNMQESISGRVSLQDIKSTAMHAVLRFIHTEDFDSNDISVAFEVYNAASFFLLPKLMQLVFDRVHDITDFGVATSLINYAAESVPQNDNIERFYDAVFNPFCATSLIVGDLNGLSEKALELLLTHTNTTAGFKTSEYNLLLCVIEWVWVRDTTTLPAAERRAIFDDINSLPTELCIKIRLQSELSCQSLLKLLDYFDLDLVCPHRLKCLIKSINVFDELPQIKWIFCNHACENTKCSPAHPSRFRGEPDLSKLQWEHSKLVSDLLFSEEDTVVEYPIAAGSSSRKIIRASTKCSADHDGISEWTIVVESLCIRGKSSVGLIEESWDNSLVYVTHAGWGFFSQSNTYSEIYCKKSKTVKDYGVFVKNGDVITFHFDFNNYTCALSVNGRNYGVAWRDLPHNVNLYPAVSLRPGNKFRIKPCK